EYLLKAFGSSANSTDKIAPLVDGADGGSPGLVAALVALSGERQAGIDKNTIFYAIPPLTCHFSSTTTSSPWILGF
ncbi:endoglucanase 21, partial [Quercus suber]